MDVRRDFAKAVFMRWAVDGVVIPTNAMSCVFVTSAVDNLDESGRYEFHATAMTLTSHPIQDNMEKIHHLWITMPQKEPQLNYLWILNLYPTWMNVLVISLCLLVALELSSHPSLMTLSMGWMMRPGRNMCTKFYRWSRGSYKIYQWHTLLSMALWPTGWKGGYWTVATWKCCKSLKSLKMRVSNQQTNQPTLIILSLHLLNRKKFVEDLKALSNLISEGNIIHPFIETGSDLITLYTGEVMDTEVANCLRDAQNIGQNMFR